MFMSAGVLMRSCQAQQITVHEISRAKAQIIAHIVDLSE